jgi:hypothetical protein
VSYHYVLILLSAFGIAPAGVCSALAFLAQTEPNAISEPTLKLIDKASQQGFPWWMTAVAVVSWASLVYVMFQVNRDRKEREKRERESYDSQKRQTRELMDELLRTQNKHAEEYKDTHERMIRALEQAAVGFIELNKQARDTTFSINEVKELIRSRRIKNEDC